MHFSLHTNTTLTGLNPLSPHSSLYELILPSFSTLVELRIRFPETSASHTFDLLPLRPLGATLQKFFYKAHIFDPGLLDMIPGVFPLLTTLELMFWETPQHPWKVRSGFITFWLSEIYHLRLLSNPTTKSCPETQSSNISLYSREDPRFAIRRFRLPTVKSVRIGDPRRHAFWRKRARG
jgi:hypothetical protein